MIRLQAAAAFVWICAALVAGPAAAQTLTVQADSYPVAYFAERLAGEAAEVTLPVPPNRDPAFWTPSIAEIAAYQAADLILLNGAGLAQWTTRATLPRARILDSSAGFADRFIGTEGVTHSHGPEGEHSHAATASFTWLDFRQAALQAEAVAEALKRLLPHEAAMLDANLRALAADLSALDAEASAIAALAAGRPLLASHPRYQYFARRYGLDVESVEWEPGEAPTAEELVELDTLLEAHPATVMLWEAEPGAEAAQALDARDISVVVFTTAANRPAEGDFLGAMRANLARLRSALTSR